MNMARIRSHWTSLRSEARAYPWKNSLLRMAADVILVNFSMLTAFALWFLFYVVILRTPDPQGLAERFKNFVTHYWLFWSFLALLVFQLSGFYPRTRDANGVQKMIAVLRAVSSFVVLFVFADYFLYRGSLVPRGVALIAWALMLATVGGVRLTKHKILNRYHFERKSDRESVRQVLVLGGAGYLGSVVVARFLERGFRVRVLDSFLFGEGSLRGCADPCRLRAGARGRAGHWGGGEGDAGMRRGGAPGGDRRRPCVRRQQAARHGSESRGDAHVGRRRAGMRGAPVCVYLVVRRIWRLGILSGRDGGGESALGVRTNESRFRKYLAGCVGGGFRADDFAIGDFVWAFAADAVRFGGEFICGAGGVLREDYDFEWGAVASFPARAGCGAGGGGVSGGGDQQSFGGDF